MRGLLLVGLLAAGCGARATASNKTPPADPFPGNESDDQGRTRRELESEILDGYARTEMIDPDAWVGVADPHLGMVRIGTGPDDFLWTRDPAVGVGRRRWPLGNGSAHSKILELHMNEDASVAWAVDEVSWRLQVCGRNAVVPLRVTSMYLRDGERWVAVVEHISYAQPVSELVERGIAGPALEGRIGPPEAALPIEIAVERALGARNDVEDRASLFTTGADVSDEPLVLWPDPAQELRGAAVAGPSLAASFDASSVQIEGYRIGVAGGVSGSGADAAWWAGTIKVTARHMAEEVEGKTDIRLRATFVLVRQGEQWRIAQGHVSAPIGDADLAVALFGTARGDDGVLRCDGPLPTATARSSTVIDAKAPTVTDGKAKAAAPAPATRPAARSAPRPPAARSR